MYQSIQCCFCKYSQFLPLDQYQPTVHNNRQIIYPLTSPNLPNKCTRRAHHGLANDR